MGGGWQRWGACDVGAGWGVGHNSLFSKSRPHSRTASVFKSEWRPAQNTHFGEFFSDFGFNFVRNLPCSSACLVAIFSKKKTDFKLSSIVAHVPNVAHVPPQVAHVLQ